MQSDSKATFSGSNFGQQIGQQVFPENKDPRQKITDWLAPLRFYQKQNDVIAKRQAGTGQWFINSKEFKSWQTGGNQVLWCHGIPGSGKTVLSSIVIDHLRLTHTASAKAGLAWIYCEYKQQELQTLVNLFASLWVQLQRDRDSLAEDVQRLYAKHAQFGTKPTLDEVILIVQSELQRHSVVHIIIDGLDECSEDRTNRATFATKLLGILAETGSTQDRVRMMVTSRARNSLFPEVDETEICATDDDIRRVVNQRIDDGLSLTHRISKSVQEDKELKENLVNTVIRKADRMFLVAQLQLDFLQTKPTLRGLRDAIQHPPQGLDELYLDAWARVTNQNCDWRSLAEQTLCWLSNSFRQLSLHELQHALAVRTGDTYLDEEGLADCEQIVSACQGLVTIDQESQIVRLVHYTTHEFFDRNRSRYFPIAHSLMTSVCLTYLQFDEFARGPSDFTDSKDVTTAKHKGPIAVSRFIATRLARNPLLAYAASHWGDHVRGELERLHQQNILAFLRAPKTLASAIQVQNQHTGSIYEGLLDESRHLPLHVAVAFGLEYMVEVLLKDLTVDNVNTADGDQRTALHWAVKSRLTAIVKLLLAAGADSRILDSHDETPLYRAVAFGYEDIIQLILEHDENHVFDEKLVQCAMLSNQGLIVQKYISVGKDPTEKASRANEMLIQSSSLGKLAIMQLALQFGADLDAKDGMGRSILLAAVENGRSAVAQILVKAGASTTVKDQSGRSLIQVATASQKVFEKRLQAIRRYKDILDKASDRSSSQAPVHIPRDSGEFFLKCFSHWSDSAHSLLTVLKSWDFFPALDEDHQHEEIIRLLIENGADLGVKTTGGETLLNLAIVSAPRLKVLLERRASLLDVNARDRSGRTPLHYAASAGKIVSMEVLLAYGADAALTDWTGVSTLHFAVINPSCVQIALEQGNNVNAVEALKRTPLHYYAMMKDQDQHVLRFLHEAGADPKARDFQGNTANYYMTKSHLGSHGFEDITTWISSMNLRYEQKYDKTGIILSESKTQIHKVIKAFFKWVDEQWEKGTPLVVD